MLQTAAVAGVGKAGSVRGVECPGPTCDRGSAGADGPARTNLLFLGRSRLRFLFSVFFFLAAFFRAGRLDCGDLGVIELAVAILVVGGEFAFRFGGKRLADGHYLVAIDDAVFVGVVFGENARFGTFGRQSAEGSNNNEQAESGREHRDFFHEEVEGTKA